MNMLPKLLAISFATALVSCSVNPAVFKELPGRIGGSVTGLEGGGLVLTNNGGDDLPITGDGVFAFASPMERGDSYAVAVKSQPSSPIQICSVTHGSGTAPDGDVTDIQVTCSVTAFNVGGTVTGLAGTAIVLQNSAGDDLTVNADGTFTFATPVASGASYDVTVRMQPSQPTQVCTVAGGMGTVDASNITNVMVTCATSTFTIGGTVTGLAGTGLVLRNSGGDDLAISADGSFTFTAPVASGASYDVTVSGQPSQPTQVCTLRSGTGIVGASNVMNVEVTCATSAFMIGGTVTGLTGAGLVVQDNGGDDLAISGDGSFVFSTPVASGALFAVTVLTQPSLPTQTCTVLGGTGTVGGGNVTSVAINCTTNRYMVGGTISGLVGTVTLQNAGGDDLDVTSNGTFAFATPVLSGSTYNVTVLAQPLVPSQTCTVSAGTGTVGAADVTDVAVTCTTNAFTVGGTVSGLGAGDSITLRNNGGDNLVRSSNGGFTFATPVASGQPYAVTVVSPTSPISQTCTVTSGTGTIGSANITNVAVTCTTNTFTVGGTVSGLAGGDSITLRNNGGDTLVRSANGGFTFATPVASGQPYAVTIVANPTSPISQTCTVTSGTGTVGNVNVTNVAVTCTTNAFTVGGTISGLAGGDSITLRNNGVDNLVRSVNGGFTFATPVASGQPYAVTVVSPTSPISQACTVTSGTGTVGNANITNVAVTCTTNAFTVGGTVSGLAAGDSITLRDNGGDDLVRSASGSFTFATPVASGQPYAVTVVSPTSPISQTCTVTSGTGTVGNANITNVAVTCTTNAFTIGGTISGLAAGDSITLRDNGGDDLVRSANGGFTFATPVASGQPYTVTVAGLTSPVSRTCTLANGAGTVGNGNVTNVAVTCTTSAFTIGGTVSGLAAGDSITLRNNGGDDLVRSANGSFTFATPVASGQPYAVTVVNPTAPISQTCTVTSGTSTVGSTNVTNVAVTCTTNAFTIGGTVVGMTGTGLVLRNNGGGSLPILGNGGFTFATPVASGATYNVSIATQPSGVSCTVVAGTGTVGNANVTNVVVSCGCGDGILEPGEERDPPPGPFSSAPVDSATCRWHFENVPQLYCEGSCSWAGVGGCDQADADIFCKLRTGNPSSTATRFSITTAQPVPGFSCPFAGTQIGTLPLRGVLVNVAYQDSSILANHGPGTVIINPVCTNP
jgi:large repetitive protein